MDVLPRCLAASLLLAYLSVTVYAPPPIEKGKQIKLLMPTTPLPLVPTGVTGATFEPVHSCGPAASCSIAFRKGQERGCQGIKKMLACLDKVKVQCGLDESLIKFTHLETMVSNLCKVEAYYPEQYETCEAAGACVQRALAVEQNIWINGGALLEDPALLCRYTLTVVQCRVQEAQHCTFDDKYVNAMKKEQHNFEKACPVQLAIKHTCSMTGDPHLRTFQGNMVTVPGPCAYTMVKLRNYNPSTSTLPLAFQMIVDASNEVVAENGQYYVSAVRVQVRFFTIIGGKHSDMKLAVYLTSSDIIRKFIQTGSPADESVWRVEGVTPPNAVSLGYDPELGLAKLSVVIPVSGPGGREHLVHLTFRPADRERAAGGRHQARTAGLTIEVEGDLIHDTDKFPNTMCSTTSDRSSTPKELARAIKVPVHLVGILATLHQYADQASSTQRFKCYSLMDSTCPDFYVALKMCYPLQTQHALVTCLETNAPSAFGAFDLCMTVMCTRDAGTRDSFSCNQLQRYVDKCLIDLPPLNCTTSNESIF